jgi:hypothetical protein
MEKEPITRILRGINWAAALFALGSIVAICGFVGTIPLLAQGLYVEAAAAFLAGYAGACLASWLW